MRRFSRLRLAPANSQAAGSFWGLIIRLCTDSQHSMTAGTARGTQHVATLRALVTVTGRGSISLVRYSNQKKNKERDNRNYR